MTKQKQIETLCEIVDRLDAENRQLKREKQMIDAELNDARKNAIFWQKQALRQIQQSDAWQILRLFFRAGGKLPEKEKKQKLFTME